MTFKDKLISLAENNGLSKEDATTVFTKFSQESNQLFDRWGEDFQEYPCQMLNLLWHGYRREISLYLKTFKPKHWALEAFSDSVVNQT